jgi:hypothetical protein
MRIPRPSYTVKIRVDKKWENVGNFNSLGSLITEDVRN